MMKAFSLRTGGAWWRLRAIAMPPGSMSPAKVILATADGCGTIEIMHQPWRR
jgi:hypothetical protein